MKTKLIFLLFSLFAVCETLIAQRNPNRNTVGVQQLDSRFIFSIEKFWSGMADAESYYYYIKNNTSDEYILEIEVDLTLNCYDVKPYKLGINRIVYLKPNGEFTPNDDWVHTYMITSDREKQKNCLIKIGNISTLYRSHTWQILSVVNVTQKKAKEAKEKQDKEATRLKKIADDKNESDRTKKVTYDKNESERLKKLATEKQVIDDKKRPNDNKNVKDATNSKSSSNNSSSTTTKSVDNKKEVEENQKSKEREIALEAQRIKEEKEAAEQAKREEEERAAQARQQEYDRWKNEAQKERDQQDIINATATLSVFTLLGGFIYDGMGQVDPAFVYTSPTKKFQPKLFVNNDFGFSFSSDPILFQSIYSTMNNGKSSVTKSLKGEEGYYLNVNAESRIGAGNDFYSFYGLIAAKFGVVPTLSGTRYAMEYGGGIDVGMKNIKIFGQYRGNLIDEKSISSSDVEESGSGELSALSSEILYGLKFTFGGDSSDKYRRSHISIGMIKKQYTIDGTQQFYDVDSNTIKANNINPLEGYMFEWRKDHNFRLFIRYYDNFNYIGTVEGVKTINSSLSANGSFFEIGFLRSLDFF